MNCIGTRKKEKKNYLSPDDVPGTNRGINSTTGGGSTKRGSKLKAPSIRSNKTDTKSIKQPPPPPIASPRTSVDGRLAQHRASRTSLNSQRSPSPLHHQQQRPTSPNPRRPTSPSTSPRSSIYSVRNVTNGINGTTTTRPTTHSRNSSTVSLKKSPVAQMRQDFDNLKVKVTIKILIIMLIINRIARIYICQIKKNERDNLKGNKRGKSKNEKKRRKRIKKG